MRALLLLLFVGCVETTAAPVAPRSTPPTPVAPTAALVPAMSKLGFMRGVWRGPAEGIGADRQPYKVTQTERMGPLLGGDIIAIEGRGYRDDGTTGFNAFAVVSWNQQTSKYEIRSYTAGLSGTFELELTADGYVWKVPAGPDAMIRFTATVTGDRWREIGEYVTAGGPPVKTFEMNLTRVGDTDWPAANPVPR